MRVYDNGIYRDMTSEEMAELENQDINYWKTVDYATAVNDEIRKRYNESREFAILRQRDEKPNDYKIYYDYCEQSKQYVKDMIDRYKNV